MSSNPYRKDFPLLENNKVIYLDNAATSQRPEAVIQAEAQFYEKYNANPLRGLYELSVEATDCYEEARETVRKFIGAGSTEEIIFTRNTTEGLNLVAYSYTDCGFPRRRTPASAVVPHAVLFEIRVVGM